MELQKLEVDFFVEGSSGELLLSDIIRSKLNSSFFSRTMS